MELKSILEAILFSAQKPLSLKELRDVFATAVEHAEGNEIARSLKKIKEAQLTATLEELAKEHEAANRSYRLACVAGCWQFVTQPEFAPWLKALVGHKLRAPRLSQPALETLSIIAYRARRLHHLNRKKPCMSKRASSPQPSPPEAERESRTQLTH